jgi:hypothetical protein
MAAELLTPLDEFTQIPLPIMPRDDLPAVSTGKMRNVERIADWHHPFHPRAALVTEGTGAIAVRNCRIQWAEYDDHHHKYHGVFNGPVLPEGADEQFRTVVLAAAGYVPPEAIAFRKSGAPILKTLREEQRNQLWSSGQLRIGNVATVRDFMLDYTLERDFSIVNDTTIDEFLHTKDMNRRKELGGTLLAIAAYDAAESVKDIYKLSRKLRLLPPDRARTAGRFIFGTMNTHKRSRAMAALTSKLAA